MGSEANQVVLLVLGVILAVAGVASLVRTGILLARKKEKLSNHVLSIALGAALIIGGTILAANHSAEGEEVSFEASLIKQQMEIKKSLPRMLDDNTRFEDVAVYGKEIQYMFTVVKNSSDQVDREAFENIMYRKLTSLLCQKQEITSLLRKGVVYRYNYFGNRGALITSVIISKGTCGVR